VGVDPPRTWLGFVNVFDLPADGCAYLFGHDSAIAALPAGFVGATAQLGPNATQFVSESDTTHPDFGFWWKPDSAGG
jgi:hypothetical protein